MKLVKRFVSVLAISVAVLWPIVVVITAPVGCTTTQQTVTYKTLYGVEVATKGAYDSYIALVIKGNVSTNDVPKVSKAFNEFQKAMELAVILSRNNTNAFAPDSIVKESTAVINLITTITGK